MNFKTMPTFIPPPTIYAPGRKDLVVGSNVQIKCELVIFDDNVRNIDLHWDFPRRDNAVLSRRMTKFQPPGLSGVTIWQNLSIAGLEEANAGNYSCYGQVTNHTKRGPEQVHRMPPTDIWRAGDAIIDDPEFFGSKDGRITIPEQKYLGKSINWIFNIFARPDPG